LKAESSSSGKVAGMGITVSKRKRVEKASRLATLKKGTFYIQSMFVSKFLLKFIFFLWASRNFP
jgi:hypothetical protein